MQGTHVWTLIWEDFMCHRATKPINSVQSLSPVQLFGTPWTAAGQASLSITNSWSLLTLMSIESVMLSNHLILCHTLLMPSVFPSIKVFSNESVLHISQSIGASASALLLPMNIQDWFPLGLTGLLSLQSKGLPRVFSNSIVQFSSVQFISVAQSCLTLCDSMNRSTSGLPVHHQLPEFTQTHVHGVGDSIQPSHPLSSPSPPAFNLSQHQGLFQWVSSSHQVA